MEGKDCLVSEKEQALVPPEWLGRSAVYQVNLRTFSREGTISALTEELPFLHELGFDVIYLCPVFTEDDSMDKAYWSTRQKASGTGNPKNPYRISDYFYVDPEYGNEQDVRELVDRAHGFGMRILFDLVYMHTAPHSRLLENHPEFVQRDEEGKIKYTSYHFPVLDFENPGLRQYLWANMVFLTAEWDVDGFRCDVGDAVPLDFWEEGRRRIQAVKRDAVLIDEGFKFSSMMTAFDSCYGVLWHEDLHNVFCNGAPASLMKESWKKTETEAPKGAKILRDMDNHDTATDWPARVEKEAGHDGMEQILAINYLIDGIPMVYCGNELACDAKINFFANRFYMGKYEVTDRDGKTSPDSVRRQKVLKLLNGLKKDSDILLNGTTEWLKHSKPEEVLAFLREYKGKQIVFVGNTKAVPCTVEVEGLPVEGTTILCNGVADQNQNIISLHPHGYIVIASQRD
ncbi:MAG TPA: alpha-glucosidase C-terminal domain-containing protein [Candidatus Eisenbergiella merdipullorum]|uniref:Alpha-glucosidase C-terminal domain-containing protein n=1 Tax=Candidatus Eisenbergiella merdipullorum TaxID=2838553 RepID=A0A9D2I8C1_9FIRM|nr:alpha-glucosidase C-terminal domain-containing protein [Candidatus Eisenbergiella merdipullorum]